MAPKPPTSPPVTKFDQYNEPWQIQAHAMGGAALVEFLTRQELAFAAMGEEIKGVVRRLDDGDDRYAVFLRAFPEGDMEGHRLWHVNQNKILEEYKSLKKAVIEKTLSGLIWGGLVVIALGVWEVIKTKLGIKS